MLRIFRISPHALELYSFGQQYGTKSDFGAPEKLFDEPIFHQHAKSVVRMLESAIQMMVGDDMSHLGEALVALGGRHVSYGVHAAHYHVVETALLRTLESALQERWTPEIRKGWAAVFKLISRCMQAGAGAQLELMKVKRRECVKQEAAVLRLRVIGHSNGTSRLARSVRSSSRFNEGDTDQRTRDRNRKCSLSTRLGDMGPPKMPTRLVDQSAFHDLPTYISNNIPKKMDDEDDSTASTTCLEDDEVRMMTNVCNQTISCLKM